VGTDVYRGVERQKTCSDVISHARLFLIFFPDEPRKPWQMLAGPLGSAEPRLKITGVSTRSTSNLS